ncbi:MAG: hypothetical protein ACI9XO_004671 [Paraglaciecola sp.]|jgi:hypothetical protein
MLETLGIAGKFSFILLSISLTLSVTAGFIFLFRWGNRTIANLFFGFLLILMGVTCLHHFCILLDVYIEQPKWLFLPVYYTLWFGPFLFFAIKMRLYPKYQLVWSDLKHAILPFGQLVYFLVLFNSSIEYRDSLGRNFFSPFYGAMEMVLYIGTFYAYLYSAYRYVRYKEAGLRNAKEEKVRADILFLKRMLKVLLVLFWINSGYIVTDFLMYQFLGINLHTMRGFTRFGDISFGLMVLWMGLNGWRLIFKK